MLIDHLFSFGIAISNGSWKTYHRKFKRCKRLIMIFMMIAMMILIILDQGQSWYFLVSARKAQEEPTAAKPP